MAKKYVLVPQTMYDDAQSYTEFGTLCQDLQNFAERFRWYDSERGGEVVQKLTSYNLHDCMLQQLKAGKHYCEFWIETVITAKDNSKHYCRADYFLIPFADTEQTDTNTANLPPNDAQGAK